MTKQFIIRDSQLVKSATLRYLTDSTLIATISETNDKFDMYRDAMRQGTILVCDNKPRDMLVYGIEWEELNAEA